MIKKRVTLSTIPLDLIPERKPKVKMETPSIDELTCSETCTDDQYDDEEDHVSGGLSKSSLMIIPTPSVLIQGCTPPSDDELPMNTDLTTKKISDEYSSLTDTSVEPTQIKRCRPTNLDEVELMHNYSSNIPSGGSPCDANFVKAEELNILGEEPIKATSNYSVSPYSISHKTENTDEDTSVATFSGSSIFTFTKPLDTTTNWQPTSSSTSDNGVLIKPNNLFLERRGSPSWSYAMSRPSLSQSPPVSASLIAEDTSSSHPHHIHHLHHRPLHLHHYCNSPSQPITKDVTVEISAHTNSSSVGVNNVISSSPPVLNNGKEVSTYIPQTYSTCLQPTQLSEQTTDVLCSPLMSEEDNETSATPSISFVRDNP